MEKQVLNKGNLKNYFISQSLLISSDSTSSKEILRENGYDPAELVKEGVAIIQKLQSNAIIKESLKSTNLSKWEKLLSRLESVGIKRTFLEKRVIPYTIINQLKDENYPESFDTIKNYIVAIFGLKENDLLGSSNLILSEFPMKQAFYKKAGNSNINQINAYSHYAHFLAKTTVKGCQELEYNSYPQDISEFKKVLVVKSNKISIDSVLSVVWEMGVCVLPIDDSGVFHGASWNIEGRHIIILKQKTNSHARWIFDLLHELYHVFVHLTEDNSSVIEQEELSPILSNDSIEEKEANAFANQVIFGNRAEFLAERCVKQANNDLKRLKAAVIQVSKEENIPVDFLANYIARRLEIQGENWWGTAASLQTTEPNPYDFARGVLKQKINYKYLNNIESNMLSMAINE